MKSGESILRTPRLAIIVTHPVQYYVPVFRGLDQTTSLATRVFYTWSQAADGVIPDPGFGTSIKWDLPLLDGYEHEFVTNVATRPGPHHFGGIRTPSLVRRIESWGADAVLVYGWNLAGHFAAMRAFKGRIPVFFRGDSTLLDPQPGWRGLARRAVLWSVYRHVDVAISVGSNSRDYFRWSGMRAADIEFAPHSVETSRFEADDTARNDAALRWRAELGIPAHAVVFGFAGKFLPKKDPLLLIDAFLAAGGDAHLVMFGSGQLQQAIETRVAGQRRIHLLPFQNQSAMPAAYRLADVFVLPSRGPGETWGLALNEAMASGRAVIASSRVGAARDLIQPGQTGWTFPAGDAVALASLLNSISALPSVDLRAIGERARQHARAWSTEECVRRIAEIVVRRTDLNTHVVERRRAPAPADRAVDA